MAFSPNAQTVYADGPAGSPQQPAKSEIRKLLKQYENVIEAFLTNGGLIFASLSALNADLAHGANTMAWVLGDATVANNGIYRKIGASGSGSWTRVADLPFSFIIASDVGAGTANAIVATTSIPVSSSALVWTNIFETNTSSPVTISFNGGATLTIKTNSGQNVSAGGLVSGMIVLGVVSGATFRLVSDQASAAIVAAAEEAQAAAEAAAATAVSLVGAAATAVQPPTIDLVTTMTSAGIQAVADAARPNGRHILIPTGDISMTAALTTGAQAVNIEGSGPEQTRLIVSGANSAIEHGLTSQVYFSTLGVHNLGISSAHASATYGIDAKFNRDSGGFRVSDVRFNAFGAGLELETYIRATGATNTHMTNIKAVCAIQDTAYNRSRTTQLGFEFNSLNNADKSYVYTFNDVSVDANNVGMQFNILGSPGDSGSLEGIQITNGLGRTNIGAWLKVYVPISASLWSAPYWTILQTNWQGTGAFVHMDAAGEVHIDKCLIYCDGKLPITWDPVTFADTTAGYTPSLNTMQFEYTKKLTIANSSIVLLPNSNAATLIYIGTGCDDVTIRDVTLEYQAGATNPTAGIYIAPGVTNVRLVNVHFKNWPAGVPKIWDGTNELPAQVMGTNAGLQIKSDAGNYQLIISGSATTVNTLQIETASTGFGPILRPGGPDANCDFNFRSKGTGTGRLMDGSSNQRVSWNSTGVGFNGSGPISKPTIVGSRGGNAALTSLLTQLAAYGLIVDSTT